MKIPYNKPFLTGNETKYIVEAVATGKISGDGTFTKKCHDFFENKYSFRKCLLTHSCSDALEMAALLIDIQPGDEVIMPTYTFVSTANAFVLRGARILFADSGIFNPNVDAEKIEKLITPKTKAIVLVHYAGIACDMDIIMKIAVKYNLFVVEDAAQCIDSYYKGKPLGGIGHFGTFSFHETKNIISGEGGMLVVNEERFIERAEIIREKGTNRSKFFRGEVDKYGWVDVGSSYLPSEVIAAFLYAQLEKLDLIQSRRKNIWDIYYRELEPLSKQGLFTMPFIPEYATNNAHIFYIVCKNLEERAGLIQKLKENSILSVFHYLSLHKSPFYASKHDGRELPNADNFSDCLLRLPLYFDLTEESVYLICSKIREFYFH